MVHRASVLSIALLAACAGRYPSSDGPQHVVVPPGAGTASGSGGAAMNIEKAGLPMQVLDARTGHQIELPAFWSTLGGARAVCVGEEHPNPHHHWVQLEVVKHLTAQPGGQRFALGMEMFQRPFQGVLDDFAAGHIDAAALRSRAGWEDRWGYDFALYGPTMAAAVAAKGALLALNAPRELTKKVVHHGLASLTPEERAQVPELKLDDAAHRAWFDDLMEEMGGSTAHSAKPPALGGNGSAAPPMAPQHAEGSDADGGAPAMPSADAIYTVQVIWDETMADTAARWLAANPQGHFVILAGNGHCHDSAIVNRMKRRGVTGVVSLRTVIDDGEGIVADALSKPINDYLVVLTMSKAMRDAEEKAASE